MAALSGALGVTLLSMVANYTLGKEKFKKVEDRIKKILIELGDYLKSFTELIQEDIQAYSKFSQVSQMPKGTPEEKEERARFLQEALKEASEVPLKVALFSFKVIQTTKELLSTGNPNLVSDVGVGVIMAQAALESAALNVEINLKYIKNTAFTKKKREKLARILTRGTEIKEEVLEEVKKKISPSS